MKKLMVILTASLLAGCAGFDLSGNANSQLSAYLAGKGTALGIYKLSPEAAPALEQNWMDMMGRCADKTEIPPAEMMAFFNGTLLKALPVLKNDPYGFSGDLAFFLKLYGAEYTPENVMVGLKPVPLIVAKAFQTGYEGGRSVALKK